MFRPLTDQNKILGFETHLGEAHFFFGTRNCDQRKLLEIFPQYRFAFLKQVHGDTVVAGQSETRTEADAHWTRDARLALVVQTADCLPVLMSASGVVAAAHAGWRGVANKIIVKTGQVLSQQMDASNGPSPTSICAIGPHIGLHSFEVGRDVALKLLETHKENPLVIDPDSVAKVHRQENKLWMDLSAIAIKQLEWGLGFKPNVFSLREDTFASGLFHSFRRDRDRAERQYSFIALTS